jgi:hypothetical protein
MKPSQPSGRRIFANERVLFWVVGNAVVAFPGFRLLGCSGSIGGVSGKNASIAVLRDRFPLSFHRPAPQCQLRLAKLESLKDPAVADPDCVSDRRRFGYGDHGRHLRPTPALRTEFLSAPRQIGFRSARWSASAQVPRARTESTKPQSRRVAKRCIRAEA